MSTYTTLRAALVSRLTTLPNLPAVAWENVQFTPADGVPWLKPALLMAEPRQAALGTEGPNLNRGLFQVSVFVPPGQGIGAANTLADAIVRHFARGTRLIHNGLTVVCERAWPSPALQEPHWLHIPVSVRFYSYTPPD